MYHKPMPRKRARRPGPPGRRRPASAIAEGDNLLGADYGTISTQARPLFETGWVFMCIGMIIGTFSLYLASPSLMPAFLVIVVPALIGIKLWAKEEHIGLPIFPIFLVQQAIVYALPVFAYRERSIESNYEPIFLLSASLTGIFFLTFYIGWKFTKKRTKSKISKFNLSLGEGEDSDAKILNLAFALLGAALSFHIVWRSGIWDAIFDPYLGRFLSLLRTFSAAASMLGALLGGIVIGKIPTGSRRIIFWSLVGSLAVISLIDVLLSDASRVVIAAVVGMALGKGKPPWALLIVTFSIVGFLNPGKTEIRVRYWESGTNSTNLSFTELPTFFGDWVGISMNLMFGDKDKDESKKEEGHSVLKRIDNLQNTLFVVDAIQRRKRPILKGKTYIIIPQLFIPRSVWKDKPIAHLGQQHLNLDFGRQKTIEETLRVFLAWGVLPEAIGNFGVIPGPIFLGLTMGALIGWLERISQKKRILSVEGLTLGGLLLITAGSYEMVASVLLTSTFQFLVAVGAAGFGLYVIFQGKDVDAKDERVAKRQDSAISGNKSPHATVPLKGTVATAPLSTQPITQAVIPTTPLETSSLQPYTAAPLSTQPISQKPTQPQPQPPEKLAGGITIRSQSQPFSDEPNESQQP